MVKRKFSRLKNQVTESSLKKVERLGNRGFQFGRTKGSLDRRGSIIFAKTKVNADKRLKTEIEKFKNKNPRRKIPETKTVKLNIDKGSRKGKSVFVFAVKKTKRRRL